MANSITVLECVLLLGLLGPALRLLLDREFARLAAGPYAALAVGVIAWCGLVVGLALSRPFWLHGVTGSACVAFAVACWRARPDFGAGRGLPGGSLSFGDSIRAIVDREFYAQRFEQYGPIFKMAQFNRRVICVLGNELGQRLFREHADAIGPAHQAFSDAVAGGFLRYMPPETYGIYGALIRSALSIGAVSVGAPVTAQAVRSELAQLAADSAQAPGRGVAPAAALERIAYVAFLRVLFGIEPDGEPFREFRALYLDLSSQPLSRPLTAKGRQSLDALRRLVGRETGRLRERRVEASTCAVSELIAAGPPYPDAVCIDNLIFIVKVATPNVVGLMRWILKLLGEHPGWNERLRAELEAELAGGPASDLADRVIAETLRLAQSEYRYRSVDRTFVFEGKTFPAGWLIRQCVAESHRDASIFGSPELFDPDRFRSRRFATSEYSPLGHSFHACNGVPLAYMICRTLIEELSRNFDWRIVRDGPPERDLRHWSHWRPSAQFRIDLAARRS